MIKFESSEPEIVEMPAPKETKAKETKEKRVTLNDKLSSLEVGQSHFFADRKKVTVKTQIWKATKDGKLSGAFNVVEYAKGEDPLHKDFAGVRIWRTETGKPVLSVAAE